MYQQFAEVYDEFMQEVPYSQWADYIEKIWKGQRQSPELVLDLACGTGSLSIELAQRGYDMIGVDQSQDMLGQAREKADEAGTPILFLEQDMQEFELYGTVDSIICTCDSLNYLLEAEDVRKVFRLADNYLNPGGLFIFDVNTEYKFRQILGERTIAETYEDAAYIWQNYYYEDEKINEYQVTFFQKQEAGELYSREEETHYERAYDQAELTGWLEEAGLRVVGVYDAFTMEEPGPSSERICYVAAEQKKGKRREQ